MIQFRVPNDEKTAYSITGDRRKALVEAVANYTGDKVINQNTPSVADHIGPFACQKRIRFATFFDKLGQRL